MRRFKSFQVIIIYKLLKKQVNQIVFKGQLSVGSTEILFLLVEIYFFEIYLILSQKGSVNSQQLFKTVLQIVKNIKDKGIVV